MIKRAGKEDYKRVVEFLNHEGSMNTTFVYRKYSFGFSGYHFVHIILKNL